jgi:hypothetical protein
MFTTDACSRTSSPAAVSVSSHDCPLMRQAKSPNWQRGNESTSGRSMVPHLDTVDAAIPGARIVMAHNVDTSSGGATSRPNAIR